MLEEVRREINQLIFIDNLKLYGKTMQELDSLMQTARIFSSVIGMQFGISKCAMLDMERGKVVRSEGIEMTKWRNDIITRR